MSEHWCSKACSDSRELWRSIQNLLMPIDKGVRITRALFERPLGASVAGRAGDSRMAYLGQVGRSLRTGAPKRMIDVEREDLR